MTKDARITKAFEYAADVYADAGIDVQKAIETIDRIHISLHSWQGDDLIGFDGTGELTGGIATTGDYPGRARSADELRQDLEKALGMIP